MSSLQTQIGPPILPAYSLRVQLFAAHAHSSVDKPIRCFRVVASPEATVRDFCAEAARIHEINYGEQLAVKKVQDDIGFDVTQGEVLGNIFPNTSMIRFVQAATVAGIRDSVPPDSALRFDPNRVEYQNRKRERESSTGHGGGSPGIPQASNKRQRVLGINPDRPVPSREDNLQNGVAGHGRIMIPEEHRENTRDNPPLGMDGGDAVSKGGRTRIPETPPPASSHNKAQSQNGSSAASRRLVNQIPTNAHPPLQRSGEASSSQALNRAQAKNGSNPTKKSIEPGSSESKTAVAAPSHNGKAPILPSVKSAANRKSSTPILPPPRVNGRAPERSPDEEAIYEDFGTEVTTKTVRMDKSGTLKIRNSSKPGLLGLQHVDPKGRSIPPDLLGRKPDPPDQLTSIANQVPLTPGNKGRYSRERSEQSNEASSAGKAAERHRHAAETAQREEETSRYTEDKNQEQQGRVQGKAGDPGKSERDAAEANAAHLKKQQKPKPDQERQSAKTVDKGNITKDNTGGPDRQREKAVSEMGNQQPQGSDDQRLSKETTPRMIHQSTDRTSAESLQSKSAPPAFPRATLVSKSQSSTPLIPSGRKPALKRAGSSHSAASSSPAISRTSPDKSNRNVGIEAAMPLPKGRQVSFTDTIEVMEQKPKSNDQHLTPRSHTNGHLSVVPGRRETPIPPPPKLQSGVTGKQSTITSKLLKSPILPPSSNQTTTAMSKMTNSHSQQSNQRKNFHAIETPKSAHSGNRTEAKKVNELSKTVTSLSRSTGAVVVEISSDESESDSHSVEDDKAESEKDRQPSRPKSADNVTTLPTAPRATDLDKTLAGVLNEEEGSDTRSTQEPSPQRDSRSPVIFRQPISLATQAPTHKRTSEIYSDEGVDDQTTSASESDNSQPSVTEIQVMNSSQTILPPTQSKLQSKESTKQASHVSQSSVITPSSEQSNLRQSTAKTQLLTPNNNSDTADDAHMQDEIDHQLTSSVPQSTPRPAISNPTLIPKSISRISASTSTPPRQTPELKVGASLSKLNSLKPVFGAKPKIDNQTTSARSGQIFGKVAKAMGFGLGLDGGASADEEEEEEESDSDSSDDELAPTAVDKTKLVAPSSQAARSRLSGGKMETDTSTSGSDSDSDSDSASTQSEDEQARVQRELKAEIERMANVDGTQQQQGKRKIGRPGSGGEGENGTERLQNGSSRGSSSQKEKEKLALGRKSDGRIVTGYKFSMPA